MISAASLVPTLGNDIIHGTTLADTISLLAGNDRCDGQGGNDSIFGGIGNDTVYGGAGNDLLLGGDGIDILFGDSGADTMSGGLGNDVYWVDSIGDKVVEATGAGRDVIFSTISITIGANIEELRLWGGNNISAIGNSGANVLIGNGGNNQIIAGLGADHLNGGSGNDTLYAGLGDDVLLGGSGSDDLRGDVGADQLNGGLSFDILRGGVDTQRDVFIFDRVADSRALGPIDVIFDFRPGIDRVDLSGLNETQKAYGAHTIANGGVHSGAYMAWWYKSSGSVILNADTTGDGVADFSVRIAATAALTSGDVLF